MFRSIRWSLLFWYALILVGALAALGWVLLTEMERTLYRDADAQLSFWAAAVSHAVEEYPPAELQGELEATLPPEAAFAVWDADGQRIASSRSGAPRLPPEQSGAETRGHLRVQRDSLPAGGWLEVGKDVENAQHRVAEFLAVLLLSSLVILVVALGGGWLLVGRALSPLRQIAATARRISGENLGERIDARRIQNELGDLASTLNDCFDRLENAVERQVRFTADASHELRTPLAIVQSHVELALGQDRSEEQLRERLEIIQQAAWRMQSVVQGLLTLARADADGLRIEPDDVDLPALLHEVETAVHPLAARRGIRIRHHLEPVRVVGDRERLSEVATNLYTNAIEHNQEGGTVTVSLTRDGDDALLRFEDTGVGISEDDQERVFERFFRADGARTRSRGGSGLGLAIVRHLVLLHGGQVSVSSRPGEGSVFTVRLPSADGRA